MLEQLSTNDTSTLRSTHHDVESISTHSITESKWLSAANQQGSLSVVGKPLNDSTPNPHEEDEHVRTAQVQKQLSSLSKDIVWDMI
jgi:hypothetical protein